MGDEFSAKSLYIDDAERKQHESAINRLCEELSVQRPAIKISVAPISIPAAFEFMVCIILTFLGFLFNLFTMIISPKWSGDGRECNKTYSSKRDRSSKTNLLTTFTNNNGTRLGTKLNDGLPRNKSRHQCVAGLLRITFYFSIVILVVCVARYF